MRNSFIFFFSSRRRHTRLQGDWSSDVCSSDLGGLGSLALAERHPDAAAGIVAIAPYLGEPDLVREIEAAGGLARWNGEPSEPDLRGLWGWLRGYATGAERPPLWLAYGEADRYAYGHRLLASALPR